MLSQKPYLTPPRSNHRSESIKTTSHESDSSPNSERKSLFPLTIKTPLIVPEQEKILQTYILISQWNFDRIQYYENFFRKNESETWREIQILQYIERRRNYRWTNITVHSLGVNSTNLEALSPSTPLNSQPASICFILAFGFPYLCNLSRGYAYFFVRHSPLAV